MKIGVKERQREGIAQAKKRGVYATKGRTKLTPAQIAEIRQRVMQRESKSQLAREYGISRATLYQYLE